jgi:hypothetical protein
MKISELQDFFLVGGTALALQIGHRISVDIDLFTQNDFSTAKLFGTLNSKFQLTHKTEDINTLNINIVADKAENKVKVDFIKYAYPLLNPIIETEGIRMLSIEDIIPMKLSAISGRGSKKDFYDIYYLLGQYSLKQMFDLFEQKFVNANKFHVIKSLTYFEDAEIEPNPITIEKTNWVKIKKAITTHVNEYIKKDEK